MKRCTCTTCSVCYETLGAKWMRHENEHHARILDKNNMELRNVYNLCGLCWGGGGGVECCTIRYHGWLCNLTSGNETWGGERKSCLAFTS